MSETDTPREMILVVDDTPENLHVLRQMLTEEGYLVRVAPNGERGLKLP